MSEEKFRHTTPRKLKAILDVHVKVNSTDKSDGDKKPSAQRVSSW